MTSFPAARALVTGASAGLGTAFAERLAAAGTDLVVVARDEARLEALADRLGRSASSPVDVEVLVADLATPEGVDRVAARLGDDERPIDLAVNNAGFGHHGHAVELAIEAQVAAVAVNVVALQRLSLEAGRTMAARRGGAILNVSSVAGFFTTPRTATYGATKAFVTAFSGALAAELAPSGVTVTCLCPGLTRTEFHQRADYSTDGTPGWAWQSADEVAAAGLDGVAGGKVTVIPGAHNRVLVGVSRAMPTALRRRVERLVDNQQRG